MPADIAEAGLLSACAAIVVAHDERDSATLVALGGRVGFGSVTPFAQATLDNDPAHRLPFFLVHYSLGNAAKKLLLSRLRGAPSDNIRFAPIVLFIPDGPSEEILFYIGMGFDDVICLPENSHILASRLSTQIGQEHMFVETRTYLGPDRRRMELAGHTHPDRAGDYEHTKLTIIRKPGVGVRIARRQLFLKAAH